MKVTQYSTNRDKHINEKSEQIFADNLFKISCKYTQDMLSDWKICFNVFNIRTYGEFLCNLAKLMKLQNERPVLTSQFAVRHLQKQLRSVLQIHLDQSANFGVLHLNVCVPVSHNVAFNSINR